MISYLEKILSRMYRKKGGNPYEINFEYIVKCIGQDTLVVSMKNVKKRKEVEELRLLLWTRQKLLHYSAFFVEWWRERENDRKV